MEEQTNLQSEIAKYYTKLPENLQKVFSDMLWLEELQKIGERLAMNKEQRAVLGVETMLVLLAITHPVELEEMLDAELKMPKSMVEQIMDEINKKILQHIRQQLIDTYHKNEKEGGIIKEEESWKKKNDDEWSNNINFIVSGGAEKN